jgi:hypothetical protein
MLKAIRQHADVLKHIDALQHQVFTTGEFNYQFESDRKRDEALAAVVEAMRSQGARQIDTAPDGSSLEGLILERGLQKEGELKLDDDWFSGFLRSATNEEGVVRSYFSAGSAELIRSIEQRARSILGGRFNGDVVE